MKWNLLKSTEILPTFNIISARVVMRVNNTATQYNADPSSDQIIENLFCFTRIWFSQMPRDIENIEIFGHRQRVVDRKKQNGQKNDMKEKNRRFNCTGSLSPGPTESRDAVKHIKRRHLHKRKMSLMLTAESLLTALFNLFSCRQQCEWIGWTDG